MRYDASVAPRVPGDISLTSMAFVFSDRPLTRQERFLARLWLRDRVSTAAFLLLSLRLDEPRMTIDEIIEMDNDVFKSLTFGLMASVADDYRRQTSHEAWERTDPQKETRH